MLSSLGLLERLAALVPRPRFPLVTYHGVLAPAASLRPHIVPDPPQPPKASCAHEAGDDDSAAALRRRPSKGTRRSYYSWAELMARVWSVAVLVCPSCGGPCKVLTFLTDPAVVRRILAHLRPDELDLGTVFRYINKKTLLRFQWQCKRGKRTAQEYEAFTRDVVEPKFRHWTKRVIDERMLEPKVVYGWGVDGRSGAVCGVQRFGSALRTNVHFHMLVLDGVYARDAFGAISSTELRSPLATTSTVSREGCTGASCAC